MVYLYLITAFIIGGSLGWEMNKRVVLERAQAYQLRVRDTAGSTLTVDHFFQRITKGI